MFSTGELPAVALNGGSNPVQVGSLSLPSGQYLIQANVGILNFDSAPQGASCQLNINGNRSDLVQIALPDNFPTDMLPLMATADLTPGGGTVTITCATFTGEATQAVLTAIQVGGIN